MPHSSPTPCAPTDPASVRQRLTGAGKGVLVVIRECSYRWGAANTHPTRQQLAQATGFCLRTVVRAVRALEELGLIVVCRGRHRGQASQYEITDLGYAVVRQLKKLERFHVTSKPKKGDIPTVAMSPHSHSYLPGSEPTKSPTDSSPGTAPRRVTLRDFTEEELQRELDRRQPSPIRRGWQAARQALIRRKETPVPMPGFEQETSPAPTKARLRRQQAQTPTGMPGFEQQPPSKAPKAVSSWNANDLFGYLRSKAAKVTPSQDQTPAGWARADFRRWLDEGTPAETIKTTIDQFFATESNLLNVGQGQTLWQRYRTFHVRNQGRIVRDQQQTTHTAEAAQQYVRQSNQLAKLLADAQKLKEQ